MLSEQDMTEDLLYSEKQMLALYMTFLTESACQDLRSELIRIITESQQVQFEIFNAMKARNWYCIKNAPLPEVQKVLQKINT